jgi:hypothetical protein
MDLTRIESTVQSHASTFDSLTRSVGDRLPRRRAVGLLVATLGAGLFGLAARSEEASAKRRRRKNRRRGGNKGGGNNGGNGGDNGGTQPQQPALCLAANNTCGSNANLLGRCRAAVAADNDANLICTSNTAGNACTSSLQCGAGTRCVLNFGVASCRVVIP